ncbi:MAG: hypothetical protein QF371_00095 [Flavobacteriales bacterium]|jgi:hypothetical protein|nr:hypothetical protein [Flavobacteriales bacterium]
MRFAFLFSIISLFPFSFSYAQDLLITKDADTLKCKIERFDNRLLHVSVKGKERLSQVPLSYLSKYRFNGEWVYLNQLNSEVFNEKLNAKQRKDVSTSQAGFYIRSAGNNLIAGGALTLGGFGITAIGAGVLPIENEIGYTLLGIGGTMGLVGIVYSISAGVKLKKAGKEMQFIPVEN